MFLVFIYGMSGKYLEDFSVGMLLALCFAYARHPSVSPRTGQLLHRLSPYLLGLGALCLLTMIMWSYDYAYPHSWPLFDGPLFASIYALTYELCISIAFGLCLLALLSGCSWLRRLMEWTPLRWLGGISYSLYMWHLPFLLLFIQCIQPAMKGWSPEQAYILYWL